MIGLITGILKIIIIDIPGFVWKHIFNALNSLQKPFKFTVILIKILLLVTGITALLYFASGMLKDQKWLADLYNFFSMITSLTADKGFKAWIDTTFAVNGPAWNMIMGPSLGLKNLPIGFLKMFILWITSPIYILIGLILLHYKPLIAVFGAELTYRLYRWAAKGEPITLGDPEDIFNPFDKEVHRLNKYEQMENDMFIRVAEHNNKNGNVGGTTMDKLIKLYEIERDCPELLSYEEKAILEHDREMTRKMEEDNYNREKQALLNAMNSGARNTAEEIKIYNEFKNNPYAHRSATGTGMPVQPVRKEYSEAERIAKRQTERRAHLNSSSAQSVSQRRNRVPGVKYEKNPYVLQPKRS